MLVFLSDLHFVDGTAGDHNVNTRAFELVFREIAERARKARSESLEIVFLGDTVDLLRTEYWFGQDVHENQKPWSVEQPDRTGLIQHSRSILDNIARANEQTFSLFREAGAFIRNEQKENITQQVQQTLIPGNHDRLLLFDDLQLTGPLLEKMGASLNTHGTRFQYINPEYGVVARHGHELDPWNFERAGKIGIENATLDDYLQPPIGDPITTELVTKLPFLVTKNLTDTDGADAVKRRLQEIDNVRPLAAVLKWIFFQFKDERESVRNAVENAIDQVIDEFRRLPFVQQWYHKHDRFLLPDDADKLQALLAAADHLDITKAETLFQIVDRISALKTADSLQEGAAAEMRQKTATREPYSFVVYGHTHSPKQIALDVADIGGKSVEQMYLNTGTFRSSHHEALHKGFITWKQLTYVSIYNAVETITLGGNTGGMPSFESWTGARKDAR